MDKETEFVELVDREIGLQSPPKPEDSFKHSEAELQAGCAQARAALRDVPALHLNRDEGQTMAVYRSPEMGGTLSQFRQALEKHPGLITGPAGDPSMWRRVADLDRTNGRLLWCGQILFNGGEAGELTVAAAAQGLCAGASQRAAQLIASPATSEQTRSALRAAFCEPFRILEERQAHEAQQQKVLEERKLPLQEQINHEQERAAVSRAIDGFLKSGAPS